MKEIKTLVTRKYLDEAWDKANRTLCAIESSSPGKPDTMFMASLNQIKILIEQIYKTSAFCNFCTRIIPHIRHGLCNCPPASGKRAMRDLSRQAKRQARRG